MITLFKRILVVGVGLTVLAGCTSLQTNSSDSDLLVTSSALPTRVKTYAPIDEALQCISDTGVLSKVTFVVGPFADSTGKVNAVAQGATGNFLPQGGSASFITNAIAKAGGRVVSTYFGQPRKAVHSHYALNGIFNSLDFGTPVEGDVRVAGLGPTFKKGWAQLTLTIQLDEVSTNLNRQISLIQRPVRYSQAGIGVGRTFGDTLVSGNVAFSNQERLQFEAVNGPIALGVVDVLAKEFPKIQSACSVEVENVVNT